MRRIDELEKALGESERRYQSFVENHPYGIHENAPDGTITYVNQAYCNIFEFDSPDQVVGTKIWDLMPTEEAKEWLRQHLSHLVNDQPEPATDVNPGATVKGKPIVVRIDWDYLRDADGNITGFINVTADVTTQKRAEAFLQEQSKTLGDLAKSEVVSSGELKPALGEVTEASARTLNVQRSSVWLYDEQQTKITCADLYEAGKGHSEGIELIAADYPGYFAALKDKRIITANDAHTHPSTKEFSESYLSPLGISSMLDAPIWQAGKMVGVVCNEHVGPARKWTLEEQGFATSIADFVSSAISAQQRRQEAAERARLQQEVIEAQQRTLEELSTPVIPIMDRILVMPLIGSIDSLRAKDITRALLRGIREQRAKVVILDVTGVPIVDSGVANHLNKTIQAARLKGARTIVTGISDAVAETIVDLGIDWSAIETLSDLQTGLLAALDSVGIVLARKRS
ncbi:MAG: PAS domain S-box protein [Anaerolineae bacterium]|nr:PAS domain S-box protein [Anaerolineae bacterium]